MTVPYHYSPMPARPSWHLPEDARIAFYIGLNIECFDITRPIPGGLGTVPDPSGYARRDYGARVGIWRLIDLFDELGIRATGILNSGVCARYPQIIDAGISRKWAWVAHGRTNSQFQSDLSTAQEPQFITKMMAEFDVLPRLPRGWLGPGLTETFQTPQLLVEAGIDYVLDWVCDDQPFDMNVSGLLSVPYSVEVNDSALFLRHNTPGPDYERIVLDQFEQLYDEADNSARVMALPLHTFLVGQPHRFKYLSRVLRQIVSTPKVWLCTADEISDHFRAGAANGAGTRTTRHFTEQGRRSPS
jgi:allantoinase